MENQQERMVKHMKSIADQHRSKVALLESQFLQQKQQLLRGVHLNLLMILIQYMQSVRITTQVVS
jgi:hypothetical protein